MIAQNTAFEQTAPEADLFAQARLAYRFVKGADRVELTSTQVAMKTPFHLRP